MQSQRTQFNDRILQTDKTMDFKFRNLSRNGIPEIEVISLTTHLFLQINTIREIATFR